MKIGLYFGSFNPIHNGHLLIASHIVDNTDLEKIWLVVSPQNPLKANETLLNEYQRLHLARIAIEGDIRLKISDIEFKLPKPSYTVDTLIHLKEKYPLHQFVIIIGSDSFQNIRNWKNYEWLLSRFEIIIYQRPNFEVKMELPKNIILLNAPLLDISATMIRQQIKKGKSIRYYLPDIVREEIEGNNYYK